MGDKHVKLSKESLDKDVSKSLIDALPQFLRADPLAKKVTPTRESNSDLTKILYSEPKIPDPTVEVSYSHRLQSMRLE